MGLGRILSFLALICLSLDKMDEVDHSDKPRATIIVLPKSSELIYAIYVNITKLTGAAIPGWQKQIETYVSAELSPTSMLIEPLDTSILTRCDCRFIMVPIDGKQCKAFQANMLIRNVAIRVEQEVCL